jgi:hypothetical protein
MVRVKFVKILPILGLPSHKVHYQSIEYWVDTVWTRRFHEHILSFECWMSPSPYFSSCLSKWVHKYYFLFFCSAQRSNLGYCSHCTSILPLGCTYNPLLPPFLVYCLKPASIFTPHKYSRLQHQTLPVSLTISYMTHKTPNSRF